MDKGQEKPKSGISRKGFLQLAGLATGAGILASLKGETRSSPEIKLNPTVLVLDLFDLDKAKNKYLQDNFPPGFSETETLKAMGVEDPTIIKGLLNAVPQNEDQTRLVMLKALELHYKDHGSNVVGVMKSTANFLNPNQAAAIPTQASIASAIEFGKIEFDEIGNPTMHFAISPEIIDSIVAQYPESVVNMSFELGEFSLTHTLYGTEPRYSGLPLIHDRTVTANGKSTTTYYDDQGNTYTQEEYNAIQIKKQEKEIVLLESERRHINFIDGYAGEKTFENLRKLTELAKKHPEKMFVAAGGNPTYMLGSKIPDITEARLKLDKQGRWPNNIIIAGFTFYAGAALASGEVLEAEASRGADIYVSYNDLDRLGFQGASSYATPVVTETVRRLISNGLNTHKSTREGLMLMTDIKVRPGPEIVMPKFRVLNLDRVKAKLKST